MEKETEKMIVVEKLSRVYEGIVPVHALRQANFEIEKGEFVAIMGKSGSGKSTLLHQLGLLDRPTSGSLIMDDTDVIALNEHERTIFRLHRLGYIFQEYAILPELTTLENVMLPQRVHGGIDLKIAEKRASQLLERVGLGKRLDHFPNELSGGEQQRVAIARALINKPAILLADEPCANLDTASSETVLELLKSLNEEGQTILMISHEPEDKKWVDRVIWLKDGEIEKIEKQR